MATSILWYINALFTNKLWKFVVRFSHSTAVTNIVYISLSISELQEHASSHCSLLWCTKGIVYQQNYYKIGAESLNSTCLQSFLHVWAEVVFQKRICLLYYASRPQTLSPH